MVRKKILLLAILFMCIGGFAQNTVNNRTKSFSVISDTVKLDSLSIVPGSIKLSTINGTLLDTSYYKINYAEGLVILNRKKLLEENIKADIIFSSYKTFPYLFSQETKHKDVNRIKADLFGKTNPFSYNIESKNDDIFKMDGLNKSGSISRGISFGNNQDVVVNSNLNLQLSGHLSNNIDILLAATDNNIPIQPEGNTQQLQEFDKVFIQLSTMNTKLIAGDFQLTRPRSYFMNFNKKAQGVSFSTTQKINGSNKDISKQGLYKTSLSAAVSRGKFARNQIQGVESNQGPYRLHGAENETYISVLSGTEKVYVDGRLMDRGQENDYVINYNTSELTFTAKQLITKDKRIVVEFQYSDKNYARSLVHFGNDYEQGKLKLHVNVYSEQDSKNQPLQQDLTTAQKKILSDVGDTLSLAISPSYDSIPFSNSEVLYQKKDTLIGATIYKNIFVYRTDSTAHFRVTFSNVGVGKGHYNQITSSANGKVFQWVAPSITGDTLHGSYEPVIQLIAPKKKQMLTVGADYLFNKYSKLSIEAAASNNDINTFSSANSNDDVGYALKMNFDNASPFNRTKAKDSTYSPLTLLTNLNYEYVQKYFSPVERYRSIEFERDWNRGNTTLADDQHVVGAAIGVSKKEIGAAIYRFNALLEGTRYNATKHNANINLAVKGVAILYDGSLLNSASTTNTNFYRHKSGVSQKIKWLTLGLKDEFEQNKFALNNKDSILSNSYQFWEWQAYAQNSDSTKNHYGINYKQRTDYNVKNNSGKPKLNEAAFAENYGAFLELLKNPNNQLKINAAYRRLKIGDSALTDNSLVSRIEYNFKLWKGIIYSNTFYEIGSGLEVKKEFSYIAVAPGQGVYTWNDYNNNGIKELNEFEIAAFQDQAIYIKVYTPTSDYVKTYSNQFSEMLMLKPSALWATKTGFRKFISRFANQTTYRVDRKSNEDDLTKAYNPFLSETNDSTLITLSSSFRNTLFINQLSSVFGLDISYQDVRNKILLVNGFDTHQNTYEEAHLRWNIVQQLTWILDGKNGVKSSKSAYFNTRDYAISYYELEPKFSYQPNTSFRVSVSFKYTDKKNKAEFGGQTAILQDYGAEIKYNVLQKGSLNLKANFIQIKFNGSQNTSLAFEMLDALKAGENITWGLAYQRNLSNNMQLSITYDGRKSEGTKIIHTGGAQVRAYF
ncbi:MAG: hypothetical protein A3F72_10930 [Bacteroidetes bacterium RIFCSPLOWO2_12_FULL_35_15]|nr:MAG: hypothetical protein A3F72_10930 [Bacteroidetes bacterium RIFCSPLOWO2_12_FULL_35_15]